MRVKRWRQNPWYLSRRVLANPALYEEPEIPKPPRIVVKGISKEIAIREGERARKLYTLVNGYSVGRAHLDEAETSRIIADMARAVMIGTHPKIAYETASRLLREQMEKTARRVGDFTLRPSPDCGQDRLLAAFLRMQTARIKVKRRKKRDFRK